MLASVFRPESFNLIYTFLLPLLSRYLCWWTINTWWYRPRSSQWFNTELVY